MLYNNLRGYYRNNNIENNKNNNNSNNKYKLINKSCYDYWKVRIRLYYEFVYRKFNVFFWYVFVIFIVVFVVSI